MSQLKELLYSDLARQYELEGRSDVRPNFVRFLLRLFHFRYLPNVICRMSRAAMLSGVPVLPKLLTYLNLIFFGLEVTPKCEIGAGVFFAHPVGCVIGAWRIGSNVMIFQGVGLGALHPDMGFNRELRCEIGDNVVLADAILAGWLAPGGRSAVVGCSWGASFRGDLLLELGEAFGRSDTSTVLTALATFPTSVLSAAA